MGEAGFREKRLRGSGIWSIGALCLAAVGLGKIEKLSI